MQPFVGSEIPDADLALLTGAETLVRLDQPEELNALLLEFLDLAEDARVPE